MKAIVALINRQNGMIAAKTEDGEYVIFELLGGYDIEPGNMVSHHDFHSMAGEKYFNMSTQETMDVYVQNVCGSLSGAKQALFI